MTFIYLKDGPAQGRCFEYPTHPKILVVSEVSKPCYHDYVYDGEFYYHSNQCKCGGR